ncbi:nagb/rpia/CoA transferase-like protein [Pisolithus orientalis]|uniref:nagb/rpia/CoA transferase-like protein n=1 Tax=Pisolithus orientalis TaxID=936130 RepID=UPI00222485F1|nr:nagb/rpia/CoA transferase-like protein [Pisolithus orientalis]KAI6028375.1 nagb/rpia/CoA transferase-like protein [Pisolithus orientalis]
MAATTEATTKDVFDIWTMYQSILKDEEISTPLAAILALTELVQRSDAGTMFELVKALNDGAKVLNERTPNPISLNAGCELFIAFVTLFPHDSDSFSDLKKELVRQGQKYANEALTYRQKIARLALEFIKDDSVILTHSYSRVVMKTLLCAHERKRISVYVTEARPRGLGLEICLVIHGTRSFIYIYIFASLRTYEELTAAGIPCTVVLDSAVAYAMNKVDFVLVGSEAVVESGGLINAVGSNQIAIIAKAANVPFYALAESYKFHRLFPLSQYDLPTHKPYILSFPLMAAPTPCRKHPVPPKDQPITAEERNASTLTSSQTRYMTQEQIARNPDVDYTRPDLITLVFSDVGSLTPEGVSQYLVGMFAG